MIKKDLHFFDGNNQTVRIQVHNIQANGSTYHYIEIAITQQVQHTPESKSFMHMFDCIGPASVYKHHCPFEANNAGHDLRTRSRHISKCSFNQPLVTYLRPADCGSYR